MSLGQPQCVCVFFGRQPILAKATTYTNNTTANSHQLFFDIPWINPRQKKSPISKYEMIEKKNFMA